LKLQYDILLLNCAFKFNLRRCSKVSYISGTYNEWDFDSFCDNCTLNDTIVSFNPAYYSVVAKYGSEANFLYSLTAKAGGLFRASTRPT